MHQACIPGKELLKLELTESIPMNLKVILA